MYIWIDHSKKLLLFYLLAVQLQEKKFFQTES